MKVSIVIPCYNEEAYIEKCVLSLISSAYPKSLFEVLVCDGGSSDQTLSILKKLSEQHPEIKVLNNTKKTTPYALNLGISHAKNSDVLIILGAHSEVDAYFIAKNVDVLKKHPEVGCAGGVIENVYLSDTAKNIGYAMSSSFGVGNAHFRTGNFEGYVDTVAFGAYRQDVFKEIGLFDTDLTRNQDDEFNYRLLSQSSFKIYLSSQIKCKYYVRGDFTKLWKQYFQYGFWKVYVNKKHRAITTLRQLVPSLLVLNIASLLLAILWLPFLYFVLPSILLYFMLAIFLSWRAQQQGYVFFSVFSSFLILHLSYGLGYLIGIKDFILFGKKIDQGRHTEISR